MSGITIFMRLVGSQQVQGAANRAAGSIHGITAAAEKMKLVAGAAFATVGAGLSAAVVEGVKYNAQQEQMLISFETLLGTQKKAQGFVDYLQKAGAATPFETTDLASASRTLLGFGYSAKETKGAIDDMGNAVSALGGSGAELQGLALIFGQIKAKGRLQGEEVMQLAERGIAAQNMLTKRLGMSGDEFQKNLTAGKIDASTAIDALLGSFGEKYAGSMEKQSETLIGKWSTFQDNLKMKLGEWTKPISNGLRDQVLPIATEQLGKIPEYANKARTALGPVVSFLGGIGKKLAGAGGDAKPFWDNVLGPFLKGAAKGLLTTIVVGFKVFALAAQGVGKVLGFVGRVAGKLGLGKVFGFLGQVVGGLITGPFTAILGRLSIVGRALRIVMAPLRLLTRAFGWLLRGAGNIISSFGGPLARALGSVGRFFGGVLRNARLLLGPLESVYNFGKDMGLFGGNGPAPHDAGNATTPRPAPSMVPRRNGSRAPARRNLPNLTPGVIPLAPLGPAAAGTRNSVHTTIPVQVDLDKRTIARGVGEARADEQARR